MYTTNEFFNAERFLPACVTFNEVFKPVLKIYPKFSGTLTWEEIVPEQAQLPENTVFTADLEPDKPLEFIYKTLIPDKYPNETDPLKKGGPVTFHSKILFQSENIRHEVHLSSPMGLCVPFPIVSPEDFYTIRQRLVQFVNYHVQWGHLFLGNPLRFMEEYMLCKISAPLHARVYEEFNFLDRGIPINDEEYDDISRNRNGIWGLKEFQLEYEEDCEDLSLESSSAHEVQRTEDDILF